MAKILGVHDKYPSVNTWTTFTMIIGADTTAPTRGTVAYEQARWRRVGDSVEIEFRYRQTTAGTAGSGNYYYDITNAGLPSFDLTKLDADFNYSGFTGPAQITIGSSANQNSAGAVLVRTGSRLGLNMVNADGTSSTQAGGAYTFNNANMRVFFRAIVPISGWTVTE